MTHTNQHGTGCTVVLGSDEINVRAQHVPRYQDRDASRICFDLVTQMGEEEYRGRPLTATRVSEEQMTTGQCMLADKKMQRRSGVNAFPILPSTMPSLSPWAPAAAKSNYSSGSSSAKQHCRHWEQNVLWGKRPCQE